MPTFPLAYLITFSCYGTRLHGDENGSVDRSHNTPGAPLLPPSRAWVVTDERRMKQSCYVLNPKRRKIVLRALRQHCAHRGWRLLAAHVRSNHVHIVVAAEQAPERILSEVKAFASRTLNGSDFEEIGPRKRWARHGSTRYLWQPKHVAAAVEYVVHEQGEPMAVWHEGPGSSLPLPGGRGSDTA